MDDKGRGYIDSNILQEYLIITQLWIKAIYYQ